MRFKACESSDDGRATRDEKIEVSAEFYILELGFGFYSLQTNGILQFTGFLRGPLQATGTFFLQFSRLDFRLLQSTD